MKPVLSVHFVILFVFKSTHGFESHGVEFYDCGGLLFGLGTNLSESIIGRYPRYDEVMTWMDELCCLHPEIAECYDIGKTSEGRTMTVLQLGFRNSSGAWGVWIDGGIHAREHISTATVLYIANQLVEGHRSHDAEVIEMLENVNWFFLPVLNPDGYEYSHTKNRWWRKNRRRINSRCVGADLNRNWDFNWLGPDSDSDPCSDTFAGDAPASEPEVANVVEFISRRASELIVFLTYHSYGQRIFTRWDYSKYEAPEDDEEATELAQKVSDAIAEVNGRDYKVGPAPKLTYAFGGGSADWAKAVAGIKYSYLVELPDTGYYGFQLPQSEIPPTGSENWAGIKAISSHIIHKHTQRNSTSRSQGGASVHPRRYSRPVASSFVDSRNGASTLNPGDIISCSLAGFAILLNLLKSCGIF